MKKEDLFRAVGDAGDDLIERADEPVRPARRKSYGWVKWTALAACAAVILYAAAVSPIFRPKGSAAPSMTMAAADSASSEASLPDKTKEAAAPQTAAADSEAAAAAAAPDAASGSAAGNSMSAESAAEPAPVRFEGRTYREAPADDPNRPAGELKELAGELLGTLEDSGDQVYAYGTFDKTAYILVLHGETYTLYKAS